LKPFWKKYFFHLQQKHRDKSIKSIMELNMKQPYQTEIHKDAQRAFDTFGDMVYRLALIRTQKQVDAEDVVQDVFLRYMRSAPAVMDPEHEKAWLLRVTVNCTKSLASSAWNQKTLSLSEVAVPQTESVPSDVYAAVLNLPQRYRTVIHLFYYEGYKTAEIAKLLTANNATVRSWLSRARELLRKTIEVEDD